MGCGQSKIENEEAVTRCKNRKHHMKEAVSFRNAFAAAHSAYAMSLKNTGAALSDFALGEVMNPTSFHPSATAAAGTQLLPSTSASVPAQPPPPPPEIYPPPPPPADAPAPLYRAVSMPEMKLPIKQENSTPGPSPIMEDEEEEVEEKLVVRKRRGGSGGGGGRREVENNPPPPVAVTSASVSHPTPGGHDSRWAAEYSDYIFQHQDGMMGPGLTAVEEEEEVEEVVKENKVVDERPKRVEAVEEVRKSEKAAAVEPPAVVVVSGGGGGGGGGSVGKSSKKIVKGGGERRVAKGSVNLYQIFVELDDHFLKASESAHEVSKMLEATRLHYHSNFADNRGNDLMNRVISVFILEDFRYINWNNDSFCVKL